MSSGSMFALGELEVDRYCSYVYFCMIENAEEADKMKFDARLWRPPATPKNRNSTEGIPENSPWHPDNVLASFNMLREETSGTT